jgi:undecaprenyl-diphosphatase
MERFIEILKVIFLAIVEGISEWLPISSSGHMLLIDEFISLNATEAFKEMFFILIQLGAILAVIVIFYKKIAILEFNKKIKIRKDIVQLWVKVAIACIPGVIVALLFDNYVSKYLQTPLVISWMLIIYGIAFLFIEKLNCKKLKKAMNINELTYKDALVIGLFQTLAIIPGTSRSGATIIGALLIGVNKLVASEFSFFLAIPVMFGMSMIELIKFGLNFSNDELIILSIGMIVSFLVSILVIKFLTNYLKKHNFKVFGIYRIILGTILLIYFFINS